MAAPPMTDLVARVTRELPDTDKDRYDIAYQRGRAQARSSLLFGGLVVGLAGGALGMLLLDPERGAARRAELRRRLDEMRDKAKARAAAAAEAAAERRSRGEAGPGSPPSADDPFIPSGPTTASTGTADPRVPVAAGTVADPAAEPLPR
jgi:hypothetical protein